MGLGGIMALVDIIDFVVVLTVFVVGAFLVRFNFAAFVAAAAVVEVVVVAKLRRQVFNTGMGQIIVLSPFT
jgi:hypothetical protein